MKIIAITNQKGGVGKTTISVNLAYGISSRGHKTLLIDADPQGSILQWQRIANETSVDVTHYPDPDLFKKVQDMGKGYEYVIIDSPPGQGPITKSILTVAHLAIIPFRPSPLDLWSGEEIIDLVKQARKVNHKMKAKLLISQKVTRTRLGNEMKESLAEYGTGIFDTEIHLRVAYVEAFLNGHGVIDYEPHGEAAREINSLTDEIL